MNKLPWKALNIAIPVTAVMIAIASVPATLRAFNAPYCGNYLCIVDGDCGSASYPHTPIECSDCKGVFLRYCREP